MLVTLGYALTAEIWRGSGQGEIIKFRLASGSFKVAMIGCLQTLKHGHQEAFQCLEISRKSQVSATKMRQSHKLAIDFALSVCTSGQASSLNVTAIFRLQLQL